MFEASDFATNLSKIYNTFSTTNQRFHYQSSCSRAAKRSIDIDEQLLETRGFSEKEVELYHEQDLRCRFQACILEARVS